MIELRNVCKIYPNAVALDDISVVINQGDVISVIGPSGSGKSTLIRAINFLEPMTSGSIYMNGEELVKTGRDLPKSCRGMGMVFQNFNLFNHMTVLENVMAPQMRILGRSSQEAYDKAMEMLEKVGVSAKAMVFPYELSGGQKQRAAIARTLAMNPQIIFFDEPTSALDPAMADEVERVMHELAKDGTTMMVVTHSMELAQRISNRVFFMQRGKICEDGTPDQIFNHPQKSATRDFIRRIKRLEYGFSGRDFDYPELAGRIKAYCDKNRAKKETLEAALAISDEFVNGMLKQHLTESSRVHVSIEKSDLTSEYVISVSYSGERFSPDDSEDELSVKLLDYYSGGYKYEYRKGEELSNVLTVRKKEKQNA